MVSYVYRKGLHSRIWLAIAERLPRDYHAMTWRFIAQLPQECYETYDYP